ncbi:MAG: ABC transporter permease [Candidatus Hodarchaeales archaeon]
MNFRYFEIKFQKRTNTIIGIEAIIFRIFFLFLGLVAVGLIFIINGVDPIALYYKMIQLNLLLLPNTFTRFIPLLCIAVGLAIPFRARVDNIGAEGQLVMGMIAATGTAYAFPDLNPLILIPLMFINGFIVGAIWALPVVFFRARGGFQGADVVVSFLMVFPAIAIMKYLVSGPWRDPETGFTYSSLISENARIPKIGNTPIYYSIFLVLFITIVLWYYLFRTVDGIPKSKLGYEISVMGKNPIAGKLAGMSFFKVILISMIISGGLAGIAGVGELAGNQLRLSANSPGTGFTAIVVAYLGGLNPIGIIFSALFFAALQVGGNAIRLSGLPSTALDMFSGIVLFFVLIAEFFFRYSIRFNLITRRSRY